jgi:hypothetical protein
MLAGELDRQQRSRPSSPDPQTAAWLEQDHLFQSYAVPFDTLWPFSTDHPASASSSGSSTCR